MSLVTKLTFIAESNESSQLSDADIDLHDHLTDQADWDAEFWDIGTEYLKTYAKRLEQLFSLSTNGIEFQALWVGDKPTRTLEISIDEFLEIVRSNRIGTKTKYVVRKHA